MTTNPASVSVQLPASLAPTRVRGWPTVSRLDGVRTITMSTARCRKLIRWPPGLRLGTLARRGETSFRFRRRVQHRLFAPVGIRRSAFGGRAPKCSLKSAGVIEAWRPSKAALLQANAARLRKEKARFQFENLNAEHRADAGALDQRPRIAPGGGRRTVRADPDYWAAHPT